MSSRGVENYTIWSMELDGRIKRDEERRKRDALFDEQHPEQALALKQWEEGQLKKAEGLISNAVTIPGFPHSVTYSDKFNSSYGNWICKVCKSVFSGNDHIHKKGCSKATERRIGEDPNYIYIIGPNDYGFHAPFPMDRIVEIKELAKAQFGKSKID